MRKLRKFLRILLILLPFSLFGVCFATEFEGNTVHDGAYIDTGNSYVNREENLAELDSAIKNIMDKVFFEGFTDIIDGFGKGLRDGKQYSELAIDNYNEFIPFIEHYGTYGTINLISGEEFTSDDWNIPYSVRFLEIQYAYSYTDYPEQGSFWTQYWSVPETDVNETYTLDNTDPWGAHIVATWENGKLSYNIDLSNLVSSVQYDEGLGIRIKTRFYSNQLGGIIRAVSPQAAGNFITPIEYCTVENGNTIHISDNSGNYTFFQHLDNSQIGYIQYYWSDYVFNEVPAYEPPVLQYPQKTYIDNSTGDMVTNNYYDEEVYYYNYMTNVINQIANAGSADDFEMDLEWGLLNLPAGVALGVIEGLGEWTDVCSFRTQAITIDLGEHDFTFPALNFEFDAGDYEWLTPFRYIITIFILIGLSRACWKLINDLINSGGNFNAD